MLIHGLGLFYILGAWHRHVSVVLAQSAAVSKYGLETQVFCVLAHRSPAFKTSLVMTMSSLHVDRRNSATPRMTSLWMIMVSVTAVICTLHHTIQYRQLHLLYIQNIVLSDMVVNSFVLLCWNDHVKITGGASFFYVMQQFQPKKMKQL